MSSALSTRSTSGGGSVSHKTNASLKQMGLVQTSSSRTYFKTVPEPARKKLRRKRAPAGPPGILARLATPEVVGGAVAFGLAAVFVGLVASTLRQPS